MNAFRDNTFAEKAIKESLHSNSRNMGVELFRIVSMLLVVLLHIVGHGGGLYPPQYLFR